MKLSITLALFLLSLSLGFSQDYKFYKNERFGFCLKYPEVFTAGIPPENGDGLSFHNKAKGANITTWGSLQQPEETIQTKFERILKEGNITYKIIKKDWFVVSGKDSKGNIFYQKTVLKNSDFLTVYFYYPSKHKKYFDGIIAKVAKQFPKCD